MKRGFKDIRKAIIIVLLFASILSWFLWKDEIIRYNSPDEYAIKNTKLTYETKIIAENDEIAVLLSRSSNRNKPNKISILTINDNGRWRKLSKTFDYKEESFLNSSLDNIYVISFKDNNKAVVIVESIFFIKEKQDIFEVNDSNNTKFNYIEWIDSEIMPYYAIFTGIIDNFYSNEYKIEFNNNIYPYKELKNYF